MNSTDTRMKTTLNLDDELLRAANVRAVETGETLALFIENVLRDHLASSAAMRGDFRLQLLVKRG